MLHCTTFSSFVTFIPVTWLFILVTFLLRSVEGVGTAMFKIASFSRLPTLFPKSIGTISVCDNFSVAPHFISYYTIYCYSIFQGLIDMAGGLGFSFGFPLGGALFEVCVSHLPKTGSQWNIQIMDTLGTQPFILCRGVVLFWRYRVYMLRGLSSFWSVLYRRFHFSSRKVCSIMHHGWGTREGLGTYAPQEFYRLNGAFRVLWEIGVHCPPGTPLYCGSIYCICHNLLAAYTHCYIYSYSFNVFSLEVFIYHSSLLEYQHWQ